MKNFTKRYLKFIILAVLVFIFAFVVHELFDDKLTGFDENVHSFIISFESSFLTETFKTITFLSSPIFLILLSILLFFIFKNKKYGLLSFCNLVFIVLLNQGLKLLFERPRPIEWMLIEESGYSFPSGHAMVSAAFYGILIYLIWQTNIDKKYKIIWTVILSILILLIGLSRIYLGVHYASDIIAGFTISLSYVIIATTLINFYLKHRK